MLKFSQSNRKGMFAAAAATNLLLIGAAHAQAGKPSGMDNMLGMSGNASGAKSQTASAKGTVAAVDTGQHKVTFDHEPIPAIGWPAMHMEFAAAPSVDLSKVKPGEKVQFTLSGAKGSYTVQSITPSP
ncbi:copper-binding protein [Methylobacterium sp.]|uniref:copper-binding protein n=1 Tax=Methylobacterium sp. TaxID=409 RepID=UPI0025D260D0|nr:copper-binding protein [Methylobacterium sp.]